MINREWDDNQGVDRGVSELLGYTLLIGMVIIIAGMVAVLGTPIIQETQSQQAEESTEIAVGEVNSRLGELSTSNLGGTTEFTFGGNDKHIEGEPLLRENKGHIKITVNQNTTCSKKIPLDSIRIRTEDGENLVYEAGGVWRNSPEEGLEKVSSPSVNIQDGTLDLELKNLTGTVSSSANQATINKLSSKRETKSAIETLLQGECRRPDNITVEVESEFYQGWARHFNVQTGYQTRNSAPGTGESYLAVDESANTTTVYLNQDTLPLETDDERNQVIDVTEREEYMEDVDINTPGISLEKTGPHREYHAYVEPIGEFNVETLRNKSQSIGFNRPPIDTIVVLDRSHSMFGRLPYGGDMGVAKNTLQKFSGYMKEGYDRIGVVGFSQNDELYRTNNKVLAEDFDSFNNTVDNIYVHHYGGTFTTPGIKTAEAQMRLHSDEGRDEIIILISDGDNRRKNVKKIKVGGKNYHNSVSDANASTKKVAEIAKNSGTTVHTIGFNQNVSFLKDTAEKGGGNYYEVYDADGLEGAFQDIADSTVNRNVVYRPPISTKISTASGAKPPELVEKPKGVANVTDGNNAWFNVNDPSASDGFSHTSKISDDEMMDFSATAYGCDNMTGTGKHGTVDGEEYPVVRCFDMNESNKTVYDDVTFYTNEDSYEFGNMLDNTETTEDQRSLTERVVDSGLYNESTRELTLKSNQVIVMYDFPDGKNTDNRMLMLYTVGYPHSYQPDGIIDIDIANIEIEA